MRISDWSSDVCSSDLSNDHFTDSCPTGIAVRHRTVAQRSAADERLSADVCAQGGLARRHGCRRRYPRDSRQARRPCRGKIATRSGDRKSTPSELQSLMRISYAVFCLKKKKQSYTITQNKRLT